MLFLLWLSVGGGGGGGGGVLLWLPCHSLAIVVVVVVVIVACCCCCYCCKLQFFLPCEICKSHVHCSLSDLCHECKHWVS
jgi:hypothetical protein